MKTLHLKRGEENRIRSGHLWIFSNEINVQKSPLSQFHAGEEVVVADSRGTFYGSALVNPKSLICARLYSREKERTFDEALLEERIKAAIAIRERLFGTASYCRLVYGEGDFLPGLVVDRFGDHLAVQISTAGMELRKESIRSVLTTLLHPQSIFWANDIVSRPLEGLTREAVAEGEVPEELLVSENGIQYLCSTVSGQKTGWFYDQRPNRAFTASLAQGAEVLDAFCYVGGFGVAAGQAGAKTVTFLDASSSALRYAEKNLANNAPHAQCELIQGDAFEQLQKLISQGKRFDIVSIDPPAFIKRKKDMKEGLLAYRRLNGLACALLRENGILISSSCSQNLSLEMLKSCIAHGAAKHRLLPRLLYTGFQGPDHPIHCAMPETAYLNCLAVQMQS